jgi:hypothetical protein
VAKPISPPMPAHLIEGPHEPSKPDPICGTALTSEERQKFHEKILGWTPRPDLTIVDVTEMLREAGAPECRPGQVGNLCGVIGYFAAARARAARSASSPKDPRPLRERIAAAVAELRRAIPEELGLLESELVRADKEERPMYQREVSRLRRLLDAVAEEDRFPDFDTMGEVDPLRYEPSAIELLFFLYGDIFGQVGISRNGPAARFIEAAVKKIGWRPITRGAIERALRRWQRRRAATSTIS